MKPLRRCLLRLLRVVDVMPRVITAILLYIKNAVASMLTFLSTPCILNHKRRHVHTTALFTLQLYMAWHCLHCNERPMQTIIKSKRETQLTALGNWHYMHCYLCIFFSYFFFGVCVRGGAFRQLCPVSWSALANRLKKEALTPPHSSSSFLFPADTWSHISDDSEPIYNVYKVCCNGNEDRKQEIRGQTRVAQLAL